LQDAEIHYGLKQSDSSAELVIDKRKATSRKSLSLSWNQQQSVVILVWSFCSEVQTQMIKILQVYKEM
jgi:hypothetical protein